MICLVCTGGIGSGKSYAVRIFSKLGIPAYIADTRAKELYLFDKNLIDELVALLGSEILNDGVLRKDVMASKIFNDAQLLKEVNAIVHPKVLSDFEKWRDEREKEGAQIVIFESAIFFEAPVFHHIADKVMVVTAPLDIRIKRVMKRDGLTQESVYHRINSQIGDSERFPGADYIIHTDGKRAVLPQILDILKDLNNKISHN
ncbi:MAG: dephospho-CoA kinase [Bacteroidales bacterium]